MPNERTANEIAHSEAVREMFAGISGKYDFLNHFLSLNIDKRWRKKVASILAEVLKRDDAVVLDVACGTGDLSLELKQSARAKVIGMDFCRPMLNIARVKAARSTVSIPYVESDAMNLSFADGRFDAVTIAFGLRNLSNFQAGLAEFHRVLKPGGTLVILEFSSPVVPGFRQIFNFYFTRILPRIAGAVSGSRGAYEYLPDSVSKFPDQKTLADLIENTGFTDVGFTNLTGGIAAIHTGVKSV